MVQGIRRKTMTSKLPSELIFEILSWLTIAPILRMQCVCKEWYSMIREPRFMMTQFDRAGTFQKIPDIAKKEINGETKCNNVNKYYMLVESLGLFLETSATNFRSCRIRNPVTRQVVYLPDAHEGVNTFDFALRKCTGECKVVCYYKKSEGEAGFQVITVGVDEQWRPLKHPMLQELLEQGMLSGDEYIGVGNGIGHFCASLKDGDSMRLEVHSLDMWNECFLSASTLPRGAFADGAKVKPAQWDECFTVAEIGDEDLSVLVLEDYKNNKWSEKKIVVPLQILKDEPELKDEIVGISAYSYELKLDTQSGTIYYDMTSKEDLDEYDKIFEDEAEGFAWLRPTLMAVKGMKPEEG